MIMSTALAAAANAPGLLERLLMLPTTSLFRLQVTVLLVFLDEGQ